MINWLKELDLCQRSLMDPKNGESDDSISNWIYRCCEIPML